MVRGPRPAALRVTRLLSNLLHTALTTTTTTTTVADAGYFFDLEEGCLACAAGKTSSLTDNYNCQVCGAGLIATAPGSVSCRGCPPATFLPDAGLYATAHDKISDCLPW